MRKVKFVKGEFFHVYNRGVDKRNIFLDQGDYLRFCKALKFFNSESPCWIATVNRKDQTPSPEDQLVDVICFCLMPNHYHLLLRPITENGVTKFMRKLNTGYTIYFNIKHQRTGRLFENKFKAIHVDNDLYLKHLTRYIHLNPLDLYQGEWREGKVGNAKSSLRYIEDYPWSSYSSYVSKFKRNDIINPKPLMEIFGGENYENFVASWTARDFDTVRPLTLE